ncbi:hypothetical protein ACFE04_009131 [Oxalis oulophora]
MAVWREGSGVVGSVLIPMRFVWPYGGTNVSLEGCPIVFQIIWSMAPGYHQNKFLVDGEWRHDDHQPYITTTELRIVNNVLLAVEPIQENPARTISVVEDNDDNEAFQRSHSNGTIPEAIPRITEADLQVSAHHISVYLSTHTAYEFIPESSKVVGLDVDLPDQESVHRRVERIVPREPDLHVSLIRRLNIGWRIQSANDTIMYSAHVLQAVFGLLRLGFLIDFLLHRVIAGAAIVIGLQKLKGLLGISGNSNKIDVVFVLDSESRGLRSKPESGGESKTYYEGVVRLSNR